MQKLKQPELIERNITESMYKCVGGHDWIEHQITGIRYYYGKNTHLAILISQCRKCYSKKVETWKTHYWYEIIKLEKVDAEPSTNEAPKIPLLLESKIDFSSGSCTAANLCQRHNWTEPTVTGVKNFFGPGQHRAELVEVCANCRGVKTEIWLTYEWYKPAQ